MAPRKPLAKAGPQVATMASMKQQAALLAEIDKLSAAAKAMRPPAAGNPAAANAYGELADKVVGQLQGVLSSWMELLFATLPLADATEHAKRSAESFGERLITNQLVPTARGRVIPTEYDPNYRPDMDDRD